MPADPRLELDDQRLVATVATGLGVPLADVPRERSSFVLHAPLELLARAALLPLVAPPAREAARRRLLVLADQYAASGVPVAPPATVTFGSAADAVAAIGDPDRADAAAVWLGTHCRPDQLRTLLAPALLASLEAAGHANIYLALLARYQPRGLPGQMLRHPVHALSSGSGRAIAVLAPQEAPPVITALAALDPVGPPSSAFIAPLVLHAEAHGLFARVTGPAERPFELLRFAAQAMLQGSPDHAPYGWTHMLTLAQAPLMVGGPGSTFVAAAYLAAHWAGHGSGRVDLEHVPEPVGVPFAEALRGDPATAAAAAYHTPRGAALGAVAGALATAASVNHDAHRVKYTLACLDAATSDPDAQPLYLAAAACLNAWWERHGDPTDPAPELRRAGA